MANRSETYRLAWRVIRYRYYYGEIHDRSLPDRDFRCLAAPIGELIDCNLLDALQRGAESSRWDSWHEQPHWGG